jgi:hypothetical protein
VGSFIDSVIYGKWQLTYKCVVAQYHGDCNEPDLTDCGDFCSCEYSLSTDRERRRLRPPAQMKYEQKQSRGMHCSIVFWEAAGAMNVKWHKVVFVLLLFLLYIIYLRGETILGNIACPSYVIK